MQHLPREAPLQSLRAPYAKLRAMVCCRRQHTCLHGRSLPGDLNGPLPLSQRARVRMQRVQHVPRLQLDCPTAHLRRGQLTQEQMPRCQRGTPGVVHYPCSRTVPAQYWRGRLRAYGRSQRQRGPQLLLAAWRLSQPSDNSHPLMPPIPSSAPLRRCAGQRSATAETGRPSRDLDPSDMIQAHKVSHRCEASAGAAPVLPHRLLRCGDP